MRYVRATSTRLLEHALDGLGLDDVSEFVLVQLRIAFQASAAVSLQANAPWASAASRPLGLEHRDAN